MSGSPKWSEIRLREEQERRLLEERQRRAEEERRRREEAERRARERLIAGLQAELRERAAALGEALSEARASDWVGELPMGLPALEPQVEAVLRGVQGSPESLHRALQAIERLRGELAAQQAHAEARRADMETCQAQAWDEVMAAAERLAEQRQVELQRRGETRALADALRMRVAGLEADDVVVAWVSEDLSEARVAMEGLLEAVDPEAEAARIGALLDAALERAQVRQLAEERRAYIIASLQGALIEQGFQVSEAGLTGDSPDAEVCFRAARADRQLLDVFVPVEGSVIYELESGDRVVERASDGVAYNHCDATEARIEALHAELAERYGVDAGELLWENKSPHRRQRTAERLPSGGGRMDRKQEG